MDAKEKEFRELIQRLDDKDKQQLLNVVSFQAWRESGFKAWRETGFENPTPWELLQGAFELYRFQVLRFLRVW